MGHRPYPNLERARRRVRRHRRLWADPFAGCTLTLPRRVAAVKAPQLQIRVTPPSGEAVTEVGRAFQRALRRGVRPV